MHPLHTYPDRPPFVNAYASLTLFNEIGVSRIVDHNRTLIDKFTDLFRTKDRLFRYSHPSHIFAGTLAIQLPQAADVVSLLRERNIAVDARGDFLRISPHIYNTVDEMILVAGVLNTIILSTYGY